MAKVESIKPEFDKLIEVMKTSENPLVRKMAEFTVYLICYQVSVVNGAVDEIEQNKKAAHAVLDQLEQMPPDHWNQWSNVGQTEFVRDFRSILKIHWDAPVSQAKN